MTKTELSNLQRKITRSINVAISAAIKDHLDNGNHVVFYDKGKLVTVYPPQKRKRSRG